MPITNKGKEKVQLQWDGKDYVEQDGKRIPLIIHPGEILSFASGMEEVFCSQNSNIERCDNKQNNLICSVCQFEAKTKFGLETHIRLKHKEA